MSDDDDGDGNLWKSEENQKVSRTTYLNTRHNFVYTFIYSMVYMHISTMSKN